MIPPAPSELSISVGKIEASIHSLYNILDEKQKEYIRLVEVRANKENEFQTAYHQKLISLNNEPVTIRLQLAKGDKLVSKLKMEYEIALGIEKACSESIKDYREKLAVFRSFLSYKKSERFGQ